MARRLGGAAAGDWDVDAVQLRGFARTVAQLEWLLLLLILLYLVVARPPVDGVALALGCFAYGIFILASHYTGVSRVEQRWRLALETWVMIAFITWVLWTTGSVDGPLVNMYLLVVITSALTLGKLTTLLEVGMIAACYLWLTFQSQGPGGFAGDALVGDVARLAPFLLVAYLTTLLADDIHFANRRVQELARTDELTGLYNMRTFLTLAGKIYAQAVRNARPLSVVMFDADDLKEINDRHGHETGNQLILALAEHLEGAMRAGDVVARYGGDEFAALLPETDAQGAETVAERMLQRFTETPLRLPGRRDGVTVTLSVGIASYPAHGGTILELLDRADQAMYRSKQRGKNAITVYDEAPAVA